MKLSVNGQILADEIRIADTFGSRFLGLMGKKELKEGQGLLLKRCGSIHTCFMRFPIDATFLDRRGNVLKVVRGIRPWRPWVWGGWRAVSVLETAAEGGQWG